tara:strand:+ start:138578 stop:139345 length:768 start_codon:yes stop_codon:yes gene_type:complete
MRKFLLSLALLAVIGLLFTLWSTRDFVQVHVDRPDLKVIQLRVNAANVYLVQRDGTNLMIDSGNPGDEATIEAAMREAGMPPGSFKYLFLTHGHLDHLGTARHFQSQYGVQVIGGSGDAGLFSADDAQPLCTTSLLAVGIDTMLQGKTYPPFTADRLIDAPAALDSLGLRGEILPMPGHTEGTLLVIFDEVVFVGDLIRGELYRPAVPTRHFFMCDLQDNDEDIARLLEREELTRWFTGHFGPLEAEQVRRIWRP